MYPVMIVKYLLMFYFRKMFAKQSVLINHRSYKLLICNKSKRIMESCLECILDPYDIQKGYDPHEIEKRMNDVRNLLEYGYESDELSVDEIDELLNPCETIARDTIACLFAANKESSITTVTTEDNNTINKSLNRIKGYIGDTQRSAEWFAKRNEMLTASIAGAVLKVDIPKKKGIYIIRDKILPYVKQDTNTDNETDTKEITLNKTVSIPNNPDQASVRGTRYEPIIRNAYARLLPKDETTEKIPPEELVVEYDCVQHPKYPFLGASPDGIVMKGPVRGRMVEIKCPKPDSIDKDGNTVRHSYWCQMQLQMEVCDLPQCDYVRAVVWDTESSKDAYELLKKKRVNYRTGRINTEVGEKDAKILAMGTVWMNAENGEYVYEPEGRFVRNSELYQREGCHPAFIRHYFILNRDWMVIRVERNSSWFNDTFLPKAKEVWEEVLRGREDPEAWIAAHPKRTRGGTTTNVKREREYESTNAMFMDSD